MQNDNWQRVDGWMREYGDRIVRLIYLIINDRYVAEEIAQEVFIQAYKYLDSFRRDASPYTWLYRIAINLTRNYMRKQSRFKFIPLFTGTKKFFRLRGLWKIQSWKKWIGLRSKIALMSYLYNIERLFYYFTMKI